MEVLLALAIVVLVAWFVTGPLRRRGGARSDDGREAELADLEARKEAKYREIRDAEADRAAGKLSEEDFRRLDRELRAEAIAILKRIDRLRGGQRGDDPARPASGDDDRPPEGAGSGPGQGGDDPIPGRTRRR
jgi:hypothetical protein